MELQGTKIEVFRRGKHRSKIYNFRRFMYGLLLSSAGTMLYAQQPREVDPSATLSLQLEPEHNQPVYPSGVFSQELDSYIKAQALDRPNPLIESKSLDEI